MRVLARLLYTLVLLLAATLGSGAIHAAPSPVPATAPVKARLIGETAAIAPGQTVWVALHLEIASGWHVYWRNPGDSGIPTEIAWTLPAGFSAGDIVWPAPERFVVGQIGNYGYAGTADLLVPIAAPADLKPDGTASLVANANWLVCSEICIPGEAKLTLALVTTAATAPPDPAAAELFAAARARLPETASFVAGVSVSDNELRLSVPDAAFAGLIQPTAAFFPYQAGVIDAAAEPSQQTRPGGIELWLPRVTGPTAIMPVTLDGVLVVRGEDGAQRAYAVSTRPTASPPTAEAEAAVGWLQALLLAFLGGMILNLMPCVFPVLSLKLLGLATSVHRAEERRHGIAYAAGVILSFAALGGVLLSLRAAGGAVGWGFQLQSPVVVALLAYLLFAMGLSLSGVAEFGAGLAAAGGRFAERSGIAGAFATGILATIVATPCTAPFMGAALGVALIAPAAEAMAIFVALGAGLAAPVVLATAVPGIARLLPRPGAWMVWFKQLLAFPLYATVAWLLWVLLQEIPPGSAFVALLGLVLIGFGVWIYGRTRFDGPLARRVGGALGAAAMAGALAVAVMLETGGGPSTVTAATRGGLDYETFSTERLGQLTAEHQPVFVNLTAAWCITCIVNERTTLDSDTVRRAFAEYKIVALKGDWTRRNPEITELLAKFGRSGVPLYLLYNRTGTPTILPQILTEANILAAIKKI